MKNIKENSRVVVRNVVDSPFSYKWDTTDTSPIFDKLLLLITTPFLHWKNNYSLNKKLARKAKKAVKNPSPAPKKTPQPPPEIDQNLLIKATEIKASITVGINQITKTLEQSIKDKLDTPPFRIIFVCKDDCSASHMYAHLPSLAQLSGDNVYLTPFPKGCESQLSSAFGLKRVIAVAIHQNSPIFDDLFTLVSSLIAPVHLPWLKDNVSMNSADFLPPVIKSYKTTAPNRVKKGQQKQKAESSEKQNDDVGNKKAPKANKQKVEASEKQNDAANKKANKKATKDKNPKDEKSSMGVKRTVNDDSILPPPKKEKIIEQ